MSDSTIRYDRGDDGVVVLTLDDPNQSANTMNAAYKASMAATVDRLEAEKDDIAGVVITSAKKTFFAGGDLRDLRRARKEDAAQVADEIREPEVAAAPPGDARQAGRRLHQRRGAGRRAGDRAGRALPDRRRRLEGRARLPGGPARAAARRRRRDPLRADVRDRQRAAPASAPGQPAPSRGRAGDGAHRRDRPHARRPRARRPRSGSRPTPRRSSRGTSRATRSRAARRRHPALAANLPAFPANLRKQIKGANYPAPHHIMAAAVEGAQVGFDVAIEIEGRYFVDLVTSQVAKNMIQAFFFDLQAVQGDRNRPDGPRADVGEEGRRARRRHDGRRDRVRVRQGGHRGRAQGRQPGGRRQGQGLLAQARGQGRRARQDDAGEGRRAAGPDHADRPTRRRPPAPTSSSRPCSRTRRSRPR